MTQTLEQEAALPEAVVEQTTQTPPVRSFKTLFGQIVRFGLVGGLNTLIDLLVLNALLWLLPTQNGWLVVVYNSIAYACGALHSFLLNKYWTFRHKQRTTWNEVARFVLTTLLGIACNDILILWASDLLRPFIANQTLWANGSKAIAITITSLISYVGMRFWVFVHPRSTQQGIQA